MPQPFDPLALLDDLVRHAVAAGLDAADAVLFESANLSVAQRFGASEGIVRTVTEKWPAYQPVDEVGTGRKRPGLIL